MTSSEQAQIAERIAEAASAGQQWIAAAESLTSGGISSALGAAPDASSWFAGGLVAYARAAKHELLDVSKGPVACASAAEEMATSVRRLFRADVAIAVTGAGGPEPEDGQPAGTVFLAVATAAGTQIEKKTFEGGPGEVVQSTVKEALLLVERTLAVPTSS
ncbi:CinA family protein [Paramicrobacterium agarici]|uniref:Nicotinamide-nucleotide amidase n=1 Tax=Paramicrobacterium agarici TaxID=630514 RepID=A0A2A9DTP1_9MICO|nr:CinA family protein [Microbacterium agarici]PFG29279.1 nicotinamide-nucleotide amidase [Microbacterium agarici]TQO22228.1 nicotinamide-nucleotide amidase [Microbacterium agarici]